MPWIRTEQPEYGNPFYNTSSAGGVSGCIQPPGQIAEYGLNVLPNCVGLANGAFNETYYMNTEGATIRQRYRFTNDPPTMFNVAKNTVDGDLTLPASSNPYPPLGGLICWDYEANETNAHVAYISEVISEDEIITQDSTYGRSDLYWYPRHRYRQNNWNDDREFLGFIWNPAIGQGPQPTTEPPQITSITQLSSTSIQIQGDMKESSANSYLYLSWNSNIVSETDYDLKITINDITFTILVVKPRSANLVAVLPVRDSEVGQVYTQVLTESIPCINICRENVMEQGIPYIYTGGSWKPCVPNLYTNSKWNAIYANKKS